MAYKQFGFFLIFQDFCEVNHVSLHLILSERTDIVQCL